MNILPTPFALIKVKRISKSLQNPALGKIGDDVEATLLADCGTAGQSHSR
jgi:hypothetical protein